MIHLMTTFQVIHLCVSLLTLAAIWRIRGYRRRRGRPYPPGPRPLPIIGNLLDIPKQFSWLAYSKFSQTYGNHSFASRGSSSEQIMPREYPVFSYFWQGHRRIELRKSCQGSPRKARSDLFRSKCDAVLRNVGAGVL